MSLLGSVARVPWRLIEWIVRLAVMIWEAIRSKKDEDT